MEEYNISRSKKKENPPSAAVIAPHAALLYALNIRMYTPHAVYYSTPTTIVLLSSLSPCRRRSHYYEYSSALVGISLGFLPTHVCAREDAHGPLRRSPPTAGSPGTCICALLHTHAPGEEVPRKQERECNRRPTQASAPFTHMTRHLQKQQVRICTFGGRKKEQAQRLFVCCAGRPN